MDMSKVRVAVIGLGMGRSHLRNYLKSPHADVVAVADLSEERRDAAREEFGIGKAYMHYEELLADPDIDAVSIALPNALHAPVAIQAMQSGKHVLCEKPMAMNLQEAEDMAATAQSTGQIFMMHFNFRFHDRVRWLKGYIDEGHLGHIYYARTGWLRRRGIPGLGGWFTNKALSGGGPLIDLGVHRLDVTLWLMGHPRVLAVSGATYSELGPRIAKQQNAHFDVEDLAVGFVRLEGGATIAIETSWALNTTHREEIFSEIHGVNGGAEIRSIAGRDPVFLVNGENSGELVTWQPDSFPQTESAQEHFVDCIREGRTPLATAEHGVNIMRVLDGLYESARTGMEVKL